MIHQVIPSVFSSPGDSPNGPVRSLVEIFGEADFFRGSTLPKTNIAGWKIHHFNGIYKETWGFSWANC